MKLTSSVFTNNGLLPAKYSCEGEGMSPPLTISDVVPLAKSLALTVDDPDAPMGTFHHWVVWNIDPKTTEISENALPEGSVVGVNSGGGSGFAAACPPSGTHRYVFTVYALDEPLPLPETANRTDFDKAISGHVLTQATITGRYTKQ